jgi:WD40 repeat protein
MFALGSAAGRVRLLDLRTGAVRRLDGGHTAPINVMRFTPDARTLVTSGSDGDVIAWDVAGGGIRETFSGHRDGQIWGLAVSSDGRTLYSAALDGRMIEWDLAGDRRLGRPFEATRPYTGLEDPYPVGLAYDRSGATLAMTERDGTVSLLDTRTLKRRAGPPALDGAAAGVDFSPDGRLLAVSGERGQVRLLDARTGRSVGELRGLRNRSQEVEFSPDGTLLAGAENSEEPPGVMVWDVRRRTPTRVRFGTGSASVSFSPDGKLLAAALVDKGAHVRDARTGRLVARLRLPDRARVVEFSPAGGLLAVGTYDGKVQLFSSDTFEASGSPVELHTGRLLSMSFSRDGRQLATASDDGTATLFDVSARKPLGSPITVDPDTFVSAALAPGGAYLFAVSTEGRGLRWDVSPALWSRRACAVAGRELTPEEWRDALPDRPYRAVCRQG